MIVLLTLAMIMGVGLNCCSQNGEIHKRGTDKDNLHMLRPAPFKEERRESPHRS